MFDSKVMVGNGHYLVSEGQVKKLEVHIQEHLICLPIFLLPIAASDLVLGAAWLATIWPHDVDYSTASMKIYLNGQFVTLQGERPMEPLRAQFHHLKRMRATNAIVELFALQYCSMEPQDTLALPSDTPTDLTALLNRYKSVFEVPHGLAPPRAFDHRIILQAGTGLVKVKPYRYPFSKKSEIEKMVQQMLDEGIIQPSSSPFSTLVILVKKKKMGRGAFAPTIKPSML